MIYIKVYCFIRPYWALGVRTIVISKVASCGTHDILALTLTFDFVASWQVAATHFVFPAYQKSLSRVGGEVSRRRLRFKDLIPALTVLGFQTTPLGDA